MKKLRAFVELIKSLWLSKWKHLISLPTTVTFTLDPFISDGIAIHILLQVKWIVVMKLLESLSADFILGTTTELDGVLVFWTNMDVWIKLEIFEFIIVWSWAVMKLSHAPNSH